MTHHCFISCSASVTIRTSAVELCKCWQVVVFFVIIADGRFCFYCPNGYCQEKENWFRVSCFNQQWTHDCFMVDNNYKALCLICGETVAVLKEFNLQRHYDTKHKSKFDIQQVNLRRKNLLTAQRIFYQRNATKLSKASSDGKTPRLSVRLARFGWFALCTYHLVHF